MLDCHLIDVDCLGADSTVLNIIKKRLESLLHALSLDEYNFSILWNDLLTRLKDTNIWAIVEEVIDERFGG